MVVNSTLLSMNRPISLITQPIYFILPNKTMGTGAFSEKFHACEQNPAHQISEINKKIDIIILLWVISSICKDPNENPTEDSIRKLDYDPMLIGMYEICVQEEPPHSLHNLMPTVCKCCSCCTTVEGPQIKVLYRIR